MTISWFYMLFEKIFLCHSVAKSLFYYIFYYSAGELGANC